MAASKMEVIGMPDYEKLYFDLFHQVESALRILGNAQINVEELFIKDPVLTQLIRMDDLREKD